MFKINKHFFFGTNKPYLITAIILFIVFIAYYFLILYLRIGTDVQLHADIAFKFFTAHQNITPNFLYYFLVGLLAGFSKHKMAYYAGSVILVSGAIVFKFLVNVFYLRKFTLLNTFITTMLAIMLLFIFSLPGINFFETQNFYKGQLTPNVWHNSTVILLAPFSIILFFETIRFINRKTISSSQQAFIFLLILLNALIKPSFLFTIIPTVILFVIYFSSKVDFKKSIVFLLPYLAGVFFIAFEYVLIYKFDTDQSIFSTLEKSSIAFSPFEMWNYYSSNIPIAFFTSCLFPVAYFFYTKGSVLKNQIVSFACINFLFAILIWILFIETGVRKYYGNFYWQVVIGNYLLFYAMVIHFLQQVKSKVIKPRAKKILFGLFICHFLWGVIYWVRIIWCHDYS